MSEESSGPHLTQKLKKWFDQQGYPLEYQVTRSFALAGFYVQQSAYVDTAKGSPREIDVIATQEWEFSGSRIRLASVVECKKTAKPWIVFTSPYNHMSPKAVIAQSIGNASGTAVARQLSEAVNLYTTSTFGRGPFLGFGGRQAFSDAEVDVFYNSLRSVTDVAYHYALGYDRTKFVPLDALQYVVLALPMIVIGAPLFEARQDLETGDTHLVEVSASRIHWRGASVRPLYNTVDVVTEAGLEPFLRQRAKDLKLAKSDIETCVGELWRHVERSQSGLYIVADDEMPAYVRHFINQIRYKARRGKATGTANP